MGIRKADPKKMSPGMTLLVSSWAEKNTGDLRPGAKLINEDGNVVHSWKPNRDELFPNPTGSINTDPSKGDFHHVTPEEDVSKKLTSWM